MKSEVAVASVIMALSVTAVYGKECKGVPFPDRAQTAAAITH